MGSLEFFRKTIEAGVVASSVLLSGGPATASESEKNIQDIPALVTFVRNEKDRSQEQTVFYPDSPRDIQRGKRLAGILQKFDVEIGKLYGMRRAAENNSLLYARREEVSRIPSSGELRSVWKKAWHAFQGVMPNLPKTYSDASFFKTLITDVPRELAFSWLMSEQQMVTYGDSNAPEAFEMRSNVYPIIKKEQLQRNIFGVPVRTPVLYLGKPLHESTKRTGEMASMRFGSIFVSHQADEMTRLVWHKAASFIEQTLDGVVGEPRSLPPDSNMRNDLICMLVLKDLFSRSTEPVENDIDQSHVSHELGHFVNSKDKGFKDSFVIHKQGATGDALVALSVNESTHEEIDAILSSLRYSSQKNLPLFEFVNYLISNRDRMSFSHHRASQWIRKYFIEEVRKDPTRYGIIYNRTSVFTSDEQIFVALPRIIQENPSAFDSVWESLWTLHRTQLDVNLLTGLPESSDNRKEEKQDMAFPLVLAAGIGACGIVAALHALRKKSISKKQSARSTK
ncbi:MAG: hypothetical protein AAB400_00715 [Patescibacteria group bacterium]